MRLIICIGVLLLWSCQHQQGEQFRFKESRLTLITSDSIQLITEHARGSVMYNLSPKIGSLINGYYYAPSTLLKDSTPVWITATDGNSQISMGVLLIKRSAADTVISFSQVIMPLLVANCNFKACHGNGSRAGKVSLEGYDSVMLHVKPYQPKSSLLYQSLIKTDPLRRMPPAGPLHGYKVNFVYAWIEQGAVRN